MISINNISVIFSGEILFEHISFNVNIKNRIGLVGKNGAGKTTLLKIIAGIQEKKTGRVVIPEGYTIGYLPQEKIIKSEKTIYEEATLAFSHIINLEQQIKFLNKELAVCTDFNSKEYLSLIKDLNDYTDQYTMLGGTSIDADIEKVLIGLGFSRSDFSRTMPEFSGGWQMRVELAKILLQKPDLILLDEPTNHLDIESIQWLEKFLSTYNGAIILVSHDRAFLDNVSNRTIEIVNGKVYDYKTSYSEFIKLRLERIELQKAALTNQQKQIEQIQSFVERFRYKATKAKQVQSRLKMLDKINTVNIDDKEIAAIRFKFPSAPHSGKIVVEASNVSKAYNNKTILKNLDFIIEKGAKVAFVGKNGEGKTTLVKVINNTVEYTGKLKIGHNIKIGYYAQDQANKLNPEKTIFETIDDIATGEMRKEVRNILGSFLFSGDAIEKKVKVLSGGEKSRLALACMLLEPVNLLILDEPTNHLDMVSKDILKNALILFNGTLIVVSHDRDFLQGLTDRVYEFQNKTIKEHKGDIYEFLEIKKLATLNELNKKQAEQNKGNKQKTNNKQNWLQKKEHDKKLRKIKKEIEQCETEINTLDEELEKIDTILNSSTNSNKQNSDIYTNYQNLRESQEKIMLQWETLQKELEKIENKKET